jgi:hypothetical protein
MYDKYPLGFLTLIHMEIRADMPTKNMNPMCRNGFRLVYVCRQGRRWGADMPTTRLNPHGRFPANPCFHPRMRARTPTRPLHLPTLGLAAR